jgi:predicted ABC-type ATPase
MTTERPACVMLAGPNGAGKSTIYKALSLPGPFVNADEVARELSPSEPETASIRAGRLVLRRLAELIETRQSFTYTRRR